MALRGKVRTKDGWAIRHAAVTVTDTSGNQVLRGEADADGEVLSDSPLTPGVYTVIVTAAGYAPTASTALIGPSGLADLGTVTLERLGGGELPPPGTWTVDPAHSSIGVVARHLGISSVHGRFGTFGATLEIAAGNVEDSTVSATIEAASIDTGNKMRDDHLRSPDFLDVAAHPLITYFGSRVTPVGGDSWTVHGELTINAITRPVDLDLTYLGTGPDPWGGERAAFRATTELKRSDFAMNYNQVLQAGIAAVGTTLRVELDIQAVRGELPM
ncbi:YceI family protein [Streptomyces capparidis]